MLVIHFKTDTTRAHYAPIEKIRKVPTCIFNAFWDNTETQDDTHFIKHFYDIYSDYESFCPIHKALMNDGEYPLLDYVKETFDYYGIPAHRDAGRIWNVIDELNAAFIQPLSCMMWFDLRDSITTDEIFDMADDTESDESDTDESDYESEILNMKWVKRHINRLNMKLDETEQVKSLDQLFKHKFAFERVILRSDFLNYDRYSDNTIVEKRLTGSEITVYDIIESCFALDYYGINGISNCRINYFDVSSQTTNKTLILNCILSAD